MLKYFTSGFRDFVLYKYVSWWVPFKCELAPPKTVSYVDLTKYTGKWYEIASYPQPYEKNCTGVTATYGLLKDGGISVLNRCYKYSLDGRVKEVKGKAWVVDKETNAKLKVQFYWPFTSDYWIIDLGSNYEYSVVSDPTRNTLWILSRTKEIDPKLYDIILEKLKDQHFDISKLKKMKQC